MKNKITAAVFCCLMAVASAARGETYYLIKSEKKSSAAYAIDNADGWQDASGIKCAAGSLDPTATYVVRGHLTTAGTHVSFAGKRLEIGVLDDTIGTLRLYANTSFSSSSDGLHLNNGSISVQQTYSISLAGDVTVNSPSTAPFSVTWGYGERDVMLTFSGRISSSDAAYWNIGGRDAISEKSQTNVLVRFSGDCSGFGGTMNFVKSSAIAACSDTVYGTKALFDNTAMPGTIVLNAANMLGVNLTNGVLSAGTLTLAAGTRLVVPVAGNTNGIIRVTDACSVSGPVEIEPTWVGATDWHSGAERRYPVLQAPYGSSFTEANFVLLRNTTVPNVTLTLQVLDDAVAQTRTLYIVRPATRDMVTLVEIDDFQRALEVEVSSAFDRASAWSDGRLPHNDVDYLVEATNDTYVCWISTRTGSDTDYSSVHSLTLGYGAGLNIRHTTGISIPGLTMLDGSKIWLSKVPSGSSAAITGTLNIPGGSASIGAYNGRTLTVAATLSGSGELVFSGETGTSAYRGIYVISGINDGFYGTIKLWQNKGFEFGDNYQSVLFSDARNLGGTLESFNWKALSISNMAVLQPRVSVTLGAESNRGLFLGSNSRINVPDVAHTLKVAWPVTLDGHFYKMGAGTLELASTLGFASADGTSRTSAPLADKNLITVYGGNLSVSHVDAINGAQVAFSNETALVLNADLSDPDLTRWGIRNVKTDTPFVLDGDAALPVSVAFTSGTEAQKNVFTQGVVTVTSAAAIALEGRVSPVLKNPLRGYRARPAVLDDGGLRTYAFVFTKRGSHITLR